MRSSRRQVTCSLLPRMLRSKMRSDEVTDFWCTETAKTLSPSTRNSEALNVYLFGRSSASPESEERAVVKKSAGPGRMLVRMTSRPLM